MKKEELKKLIKEVIVDEKNQKQLIAKLRSRIDLLKDVNINLKKIAEENEFFK